MAGPGFNEAALRENTTLKVDRVTLQRELAHARKTLSQAERDLENHRHHLQDVQEKMKRKHLDDDLRHELEFLRREVVSKQTEVEELNHKLGSAAGEGDLEELEEKLRTKEALLDDRDDNIFQLQAQVQEDEEELVKMREELEAGRERIKKFEDDVNDVGDHAAQLRECQEELQLTRQALEKLKNSLQAAHHEAQEAKQNAQKAIEIKDIMEHDLNEVYSFPDFGYCTDSFLIFYCVATR